MTFDIPLNSWVIVDLERLVLLAASAVPAAASAPNFLNGLRLLIKSSPLNAALTAEIPALAVMNPATIARIPLVIPFKIPGGIALTNLDIAEIAWDIQLTSVPRAEPIPEMIDCICELPSTSPNDEPMVLRAFQVSCTAALNDWKAPVSANELMKLLTDVVAMFRACEIPLAMSPNTEPMPCMSLLPSILLNSCLIELEI